MLPPVLVSIYSVAGPVGCSKLWITRIDEDEETFLTVPEDMPLVIEPLALCWVQKCFQYQRLETTLGDDFAKLKLVDYVFLIRMAKCNCMCNAFRLILSQIILSPEG
jgi:hypothetical protein